MRTPKLILLAGLLSFGFGLMLVVFSDKIEGLIWYAVPVTLLGLCLLWFWFRPGRRAADEEAVSAPLTPDRVPGPWYPAAILAVLVVGYCWILYWTKFRAR
jgi:cbb3-type cytochrome oxidase subunit 3